MNECSQAIVWCASSVDLCYMYRVYVPASAVMKSGLAQNKSLIFYCPFHFEQYYVHSRFSHHHDIVYTYVHICLCMQRKMCASGMGLHNIMH